MKFQVVKVSVAQVLFCKSEPKDEKSTKQKHSSGPIWSPVLWNRVRDHLKSEQREHFLLFLGLCVINIFYLFPLSNNSVFSSFSMYRILWNKIEDWFYVLVIFYYIKFNRSPCGKILIHHLPPVFFMQIYMCVHSEIWTFF